MTPDQELILAAIQTSGLSARRFARSIMGRDERTIRRWVGGQSPIPKAARAFLRQYIEGVAGRVGD